MSIARSRRRVAAVLAACFSIAAMNAASAAIITSTPTLPVLGVPYASSIGAGCFPAAGICVSPGTLILTSVVSSMFNSGGQDIVANVSYAGTLTNLANVPLGPVNLTGTMEQEILGRTLPDELGSWAVELINLSLSGTVLGHTLTLMLDGSTPSTGTTSIAFVGDDRSPLYRIDSFFDIFVDLTLDTTPPLNAKRNLQASLLPEPASLALVAVGLLALASRRRRIVT